MFIHIGYPKAASTTLQKQLFEKHPAILNLGVFPTGNIGNDTINYSDSNIFINDKELQRLHYNISMLDDFQYDQLNMKNLYNSIYQKYVQDLKPKRVTIISNERFVSVNFSHNDIGAKAKRLSNLFPEARIIIVIRNQIDLLISQYRDHPFDPRCFSIGKSKNIDDWISIALDNELKIIESLNYYKVIQLYEDLFPKNNVGVFLFEDLVYKTDVFASKLSSFMGISLEKTKDYLKLGKQNTGVSNRYNIYRKILREFPILFRIANILPSRFKDSVRSTVESTLKNGKKKNYKLSRVNVDRLQEYYGSCNKKLQKKLNLNLKIYKYPLI